MKDALKSSKFFIVHSFDDEFIIMREKEKAS